MSIGSIRLITTQKMLKTWSVKSVNQHYLGSNHMGKGNSCSPCALCLANLSLSLTLHFYEFGRKSQAHHPRHFSFGFCFRTASQAHHPHHFS